MPLITKWMGLPRTEDPYWACPSDMPYGNGIVEADCPTGKEGGSHVVIPCLYHLDKLTKLINIGWEVSVSETKFMSDGVKAAFRHEFPEAIGAFICLLIKGVDTPKILPLPSRTCGH